MRPESAGLGIGILVGKHDLNDSIKGSVEILGGDGRLGPCVSACPLYNSLIVRQIAILIEQLPLLRAVSLFGLYIKLQSPRVQRAAPCEDCMGATHQVGDTPSTGARGRYSASASTAV